ncbi:MAG: hypothetical protein EAZ79_08765 [Oscillatoriales cyanobacterium]|nr:MAG: hypothetical protein EAZ79_08765 [Oscillatoriales cyanobacterium]
MAKLPIAQSSQTAVESDLLCLRIKSKAAQVVNPSKHIVLYRKHISFVRKSKILILLGLVAVDRALRFFIGLCASSYSAVSLACKTHFERLALFVLSGSESCETAIDRAFELYLIHSERSSPPAFCRGPGAVALGKVKDAISLKSLCKILKPTSLSG